MMSTFFVFKTKVNPHTIGRSKSCHLKTSPFLTDYSSEHTTCLDKTSNLYTLKEDPLWMLDEQHQKAWGGRGGGGVKSILIFIPCCNGPSQSLNPRGTFSSVASAPKQSATSGETGFMLKLQFLLSGHLRHMPGCAKATSPSLTLAGPVRGVNATCLCQGHQGHTHRPKLSFSKALPKTAVAREQEVVYGEQLFPVHFRSYLILRGV